jgi:hypothetical protein
MGVMQIEAVKEKQSVLCNQPTGVTSSNNVRYFRNNLSEGHFCLVHFGCNQIVGPEYCGATGLKWLARVYLVELWMSEQRRNREVIASLL